MLPDVNNKERDKTKAGNSVLIRGISDLKLFEVRIIGQPGPARSLNAHGVLGDEVLEVVEAAELLLNGLFELG